MDVIVQKIVDIEHMAQKVVEDAKAEEMRIEEELKRKIKEMEKDIDKKAERKIKQLLERSNKEAQNKISKINLETERKLEEMERSAKINSKAWEDEIFRRIVRW